MHIQPLDPERQTAVVSLDRVEASWVAAKMDFFPLWPTILFLLDHRRAQMSADPNAWPLTARLGYKALEHVGGRLYEEADARARDLVATQGAHDPAIDTVARIAHDIFQELPRYANKVVS